MDKKEKDPPSAPRKLRFIPKPQPRRTVRKDTVPERDPAQAAAEGQEFIRVFNERHLPKAEKTTSPIQVPFDHEATRLNSIRVPASGTTGNSSRVSKLKSDISDKKQELKDDISSIDDAPALAEPRKNEYKEPWDYNSNYPITLPLRKPNSGDPALLDEEEFGEASKNKKYDESSINPAEDLGLLKESEKPEMFFMKLPSTLPFVKRAASAKGKEETGATEKGGTLRDLPGGYMGKMQVYKSGAVKLKLGDIIYNVNPGIECDFARDFVAVNIKEKEFCVLGEQRKIMNVTPNTDYLEEK